MADVTVKYNGQSIAALDGTGSKTLKTGGTYCEGDIEVDYAPRCRSYELTLPVSDGWTLLATLDEDVLEHINDDTFAVMLHRMGDWEYVFYQGTFYVCGNNQVGVHTNGRIMYGYANRMTGETITSAGYIFAPANNASRTVVDGCLGQFLLEGDKYYLRPENGGIAAGTYRLVFTW